MDYQILDALKFKLKFIEDEKKVDIVIEHEIAVSYSALVGSRKLFIDPYPLHGSRLTRKCQKNDETMNAHEVPSTPLQTAKLNPNELGVAVDATANLGSRWRALFGPDLWNGGRTVKTNSKYFSISIFLLNRLNVLVISSLSNYVREFIPLKEKLR